MGFYDFAAKKMDGKEHSMDEYKGKVVVVVNTASKCGLTPQFKELEELYEKYNKDGLEIIGFPCNQFAGQDPAGNDEIHSFCQRNYGVSFPMFEKIDVNGENTHPIYKYLKKEAKGTLGNNVKWNFTKFLIDKEGKVVKRVAPTVNPIKMEDEIKELLRK